MSLSKRIILILSLCIFVGCGVYLGKYLYESHQAQKSLSALQDIVESGNAKTDKKSALTDAQEPQNEEAKEVQEKYAPNGMLQGYYDAYQKNHDMVGWIKISGTKINYPVMYRHDSNEYYLHRNFDKEYQYSGLPFLDSQCDLALPSDNLIIYAHNMKDGSMFASLLDYEEKSFFKEHQIIDFDTNYRRGKYQIFAVFSTKVGSNQEFKYYEKTEFENYEDFEAYINRATKLSFYDTGISVSFGEQILTLSTCSYHRSDERTVVMAKKIE